MNLDRPGRRGVASPSGQSARAVPFTDHSSDPLVAQFDTPAASQVRTRREPGIKLGTRVFVSTRAIVLRLPGALPWLALWRWPDASNRRG